MKTIQRDSKIEYQGESRRFGMDVNAKAFKVLSSGIYRDKIAAIIREISTNAYDSHIEAGTKRKIEVHLPKLGEEYFSVEDWGVGLSEYDITNTYSIYFKSTKENTNKQTGCLGLGSKVGFAYNTHKFTVESWYNGTHYIYSFFLGNGSLPEYTKLVEEPTTRENGVKVELAVPRSDFEDFAEKAGEIYYWFGNKPIITGGAAKIYSPNIILDNKKWFVDKDSDTSYVLMGNVAYPIELLDQSLKKYNKLIDKGIVFRVPMGAIEFSSSREGLEYTPYTIAALHKLFKGFQEEINEVVSDRIKGATSLWQARCLAKDVQKHLRITVTPSWNGEVVEHIDGSFEYKNLLGVDYRVFASDGRQTSLRNAVQVSTKIFHSDKKVGFVGRTRDYAKDNGCYAILLIDDKSKFDVLGVTEGDYSPLSLLPPSKPRLGTKRGKTNILSLYTPSYYKTHRFSSTTHDIEDGGYYVVRHSYSLVHKDYVDYVLNDILRDLSSLKKLPTVYAIQEKHVDKLNDKWKPIDTIFDKVKAEIVKEYRDYKQQTVNRNVYDRFLMNHRSDFLILESAADYLPVDHEITQFVHRVKNLRKAPLNLSDSYIYDRLLDTLKIKIGNLSYPSINGMHDLLDKYPMIKTRRSSLEITDYITKIDKGII